MQKDKLFSFNTPEFPEYKLDVLDFKGYQELGELFAYEIDLIADKSQDIDFDKMLNTEVSLQLHNPDADDIYIHGVLEYFEAHQMIDNAIHYKTRLVPKLWWLTLAQYQQIFLDKKLPDIIESILKDARFTSNDYEFRLQESYDKREYVCQYKESRYDFIKRWMYRDGIYFYFESDANGCKVVFTDAKDTHKKLPNMDKISYKPDSGLQEYDKQAVSSIVYRSKNSIESVRMKNYNYEKPSLEIHTVTDSSSDKYKETYIFGNNIKSQEEAKKLSEIHIQRYNCLQKEINGESNILALSVGNIYTLQNYFKKDLNGDYLMVRVDSEGSQREFLTSGVRDNEQKGSFYHNSFVTIPAHTQYRMQTTPQWPYIGGMISATIDAQGSGETAELDKYGRYKVIMPFDLSGRDKGKASTYLRMAQASAGEKQGIHFPLHKGTEVLVAFKGGDPDQPIITGAVPNVNMPSPVNENNVTQNVIQTHGGNRIEMEDTPGKAYIKMAVHDNLSSITIHNQDDDSDSSNDSNNDEDKEEDETIFGIHHKTDHEASLFGLKFETQGDSQSFTRGNTLDVTLGTTEEYFIGACTEAKVAEVLEFFGGFKQELGLSDIWEAIAGTKKGVAPIAEHIVAEINNVSENVTQVVNNHQHITRNVTEVIENNVEITEDMIADYVRNIVNGMNLTQTLEEEIQTIVSSVLTREEAIEVINSIMITIDDQISKVQNSFKSVEFEIGKVEGILSQAKFVKSGSELREEANSMFLATNELSIYN